MELNQFNFKTSVRVRSYEVDWQGIVHNTVYLLYCEIGRVEYLNHIGASLDLNNAKSSNRVVLSRNEIDYILPARFGMEIDVFTRIPEVGNTSFIFASILRGQKSGDIIAKNRAYHVWLDPAGQPVRVPEDFRKIVRKQEGENVEEKSTSSYEA